MVKKKLEVFKRDDAMSWIEGGLARKAPTFEQWSGQDKTRTAVDSSNGTNQLHMRIGVLTDPDMADEIESFFKECKRGGDYKITIEKI